MSISAIILTKNEEKNIIDCLESVSFCDEKIVVDDNSGDNTVDLAKKHGATVYLRALNNDFSEQRNFGLSKAKSDWALFVDADERVPETLANEISNKCLDLNNVILAKAGIQERGSPIRSGMTRMSSINRHDGFYIKRQDFMWGKELMHGETGNIRLIRLAKKEAGKWIGRVHEEWKIKEKIGELKNPILHYPHQTVEEFLKEINYYTDIRADELHNRGIKSNWFSIIFYTKAKFFQNYFLKLGFLDGIEGFVFAILMSFHSFLVRGKLWLLWQKK